MTVPDSDASRRRRSVAAAGHSRPAQRLRGVRTARAALGDPEPAVRATALSALERLAALRLEDLVTAAGDEAPSVRARALELAFRFGPAAAGLMVAGLDDRRAEVVEASCFGLGELGSEGGEEAVTKKAVAGLAGVAGGHGDPLCREAAVAALGAIGARGGLAAVLRATTDKPAVRRRAVLALASFEGPEVEAALRSALTDRDWQVRQAAEDLTGHRPTS